MPVFANVQPTSETDGIPYCENAALPAAEGDLFNETLPQFDHPVPVPFQACIVASVELTASGAPASAASYLVLQTDLGNSVWCDVAWCVWNGTDGSANFILSGGVGGATSFQQTRAVGTSPGSNGSRQFPLGARIRFVGKSDITAGSASSSSPGAAPAVKANVRYKLTGLS